MIEIDASAIFEDVMEQISKDPGTKLLAEKYQLLYGTLTDDDLKKIYTI